MWVNLPRNGVRSGSVSRWWTVFRLQTDSYFEKQPSQVFASNIFQHLAYEGAVIGLWVKTNGTILVGAPPILVYFSGDWDVH